MLSTLLLLFKILLAVFLAILALFAALLVLALCVPIRYRAGGSYKGGLWAEVKVTWLLHLLSVLVTYDESLKASLKVLGIPLFKIGDKGGGQEGVGDLGEAEGSEGVGDLEESEGSEGFGDLEESEGSGGFEYLEGTEGSEGFGHLEESEGSGGFGYLEESEGSEGVGYLEEPESSGGVGDSEGSGDSKGRPWDEDIEQGHAYQEEWQETERESGEDSKRGSKRTEKEGKKGKTFSLEDIWKVLELRIQAVRDKTEEAMGLYEKAWDILKNPANHKSFRQALRIVRHVLPRKASGEITFGFSEPATTGKALALFGFVWGWYGDALKVTPVFEEKILEGAITVKGRIFLGALLFWCLAIFMNKNIRELVFRRGRKRDGGRKDGGK